MSEEEKEYVEEIEKEEEKEEEEVSITEEKLTSAIQQIMPQEDLKKISLDDVLKAIRTLETFMTLYKRATRTMSRMYSFGFPTRFRPQDLFQMMMGGMIPQQREVEPAPDDVKDVIETIEKKKRRE
ncbi:MAG: hypothetical protein QXS21_05470 [Thermoproteota archaeon]